MTDVEPDTEAPVVSVVTPEAVTAVAAFVLVDEHGPVGVTGVPEEFVNVIGSVAPPAGRVR